MTEHRMIAFERTRDILDHARQFHRKLGELYARSGESADKEKLKILLHYMSRHEQYMEECLSGYAADAQKKVLDAWFKFPPTMPDCDCFECVDLKADLTVDQLIDTAVRVDKCLIRLYQMGAEKASSQEVRDLFTKLLDMEKREESKALRNAMWYSQDT